MRQVAGLRAIARVEAYLPTFASAARAPVSRTRRVWAALPPLLFAGVQLLRYRADIAFAWPSWQPVVLDLALLTAGAALIAAAGAGAHAWREAHA